MIVFTYQHALYNQEHGLSYFF